MEVQETAYGIIVVDDDGTVVSYDKSGRKVSAGHLGKPIIEAISLEVVSPQRLRRLSDALVSRRE